MTFLGLFGNKKLDYEQFEKQLTTLSGDIAKTRNQLTFLQRKRSSTRSSTILYLSVIYVVIVAYRYRLALAGLGILAENKLVWQLFIGCLLPRDLMVAFLSPIVIAAAVYLIDTLFRWWIRSKERLLGSMMKKHREKLEELKLVTNFSKTNLLLQRFDSATATAAAPEKQKLVREPGPGGKSRPEATRPQPAAGLQQPSNGPQVPNHQQKRAPLLVNPQPVAAPATEAGNASPAGWAVPVKKGIQDRLLDLIIGSEHNETVESRYALICARCYTHNGLAPPGCTDPFSIVYFCRNCSFMNGKVEALEQKIEKAINDTTELQKKDEDVEKADKESGVAEAVDLEKSSDSAEGSELTSS